MKHITTHFRYDFSPFSLLALGFFIALAPSSFADQTADQGFGGEWGKVETVTVGGDSFTFNSNDPADTVTYIEPTKSPQKNDSGTGAYLEITGNKPPVEVFASSTRDLRNTWAGLADGGASLRVDLDAKYTALLNQQMERVKGEMKDLLGDSTPAQLDKKIEKAKANKSKDLDALVAKRESYDELVDAWSILREEQLSKTTIKKSCKLFGEMTSLVLRDCASSWSSRNALVENDKVMRCSPEVSKKISAKFNEIAKHDNSLWDPEFQKSGIGNLGVLTLFRDALALDDEAGGEGHLASNDVFSIFGISGMGCSLGANNTPICEVGINTLEVMPDDYGNLTPGESFVWGQKLETQVDEEVQLAQKDVADPNEASGGDKAPSDKAKVVN